MWVGNQSPLQNSSDAAEIELSQSETKRVDVARRELAQAVNPTRHESRAQ
jgi:hypothetical protein